VQRRRRLFDGRRRLHGWGRIVQRRPQTLARWASAPWPDRPRSATSLGVIAELVTKSQVRTLSAAERRSASQ
jgi:hypothetical protein